MKKQYKDLEVEVVDFTAEDVITASGGCECDCPTVKVVATCAFGCKCDGPVAICKCNGPVECIVG